MCMIMYMHVHMCMYIHSIRSAPLENHNTIAKASEGPGALCVRSSLFSVPPSIK